MPFGTTTGGLAATVALHARNHPIRSAVNAALVVAAVSVAGCAQRVDRQIAFTPDPVAEARSILQAYAGGQAVGSEVAGFDDLLARVQGVDASKGTKLKDFLDEVRKTGRANAAKAKKLLGEL